MQGRAACSRQPWLAMTIWPLALVIGPRPELGHIDDVPSRGLTHQTTIAQAPQSPCAGCKENWSTLQITIGVASNGE